MEFASNQMLIISDLKDFFSSPKPIDLIIIQSYAYKYFFAVVEVYLNQLVFIISDDAFDFVDLFAWVKSVAVI